MEALWTKFQPEADITVPDKHGRTPSHLAAIYGRDVRLALADSCHHLAFATPFLTRPLETPVALTLTALVSPDFKGNIARPRQQCVAQRPRRGWSHTAALRLLPRLRCAWPSVLCLLYFFPSLVIHTGQRPAFSHRVASSTSSTRTLTTWATRSTPLDRFTALRESHARPPRPRFPPDRVAPWLFR